MLEKAGLSFLFGSWLMTFEMMVAYQVFGAFSPSITFSALAVTMVILLGLVASNRSWKLKLFSELKFLSRLHLVGPNLITYLSGLTNTQVVLLLLLGGLLGYTAITNLVWPISDWDAIALYDFRATVVKLAGHWREGKALGYFFHYPPFTSLFHGAMYQLGFERVKIIYTLMFASFLSIFYVFLRRKVPLTQALVGLVLVTIAPLIWGHLTMAYTNLPYTIYFSLAVFYALEFLETKKTSHIVVSLLCLAGATWIRQSDPFWLVIVATLFLGTYLAKSRVTWVTLLISLLVFMGLYKYWPWYVASLELLPIPLSANDSVGWSVPVNLGTLLHHVFLVTDYLIKNALRPIVLLLIPIIILVVFDRQLFKERRIRAAGLMIILFAGLIFLGTYYFSFTYRSWDRIGESLTRLVMFMVPVLVYIIAHSSYWRLILDRPAKPSVRKK